MSSNTSIMARMKNGIDGPVSGKAGNLVYSSWKGIQYVKSTPVRRAKFTPGEIANQNNFRATGTWLKPILEVLRVGFKNYKPTVSGYQAARSYMYAHALDKATASIDPTRMLVSYGTLSLPNNLEMQLDEEKKLHVSWNPEVGPDSSANDQVMLLAYNVETGAKNYTTHGQFRKTGQDVLDLGHHLGTYHIYAAFVASDRSRQSNSQYLGALGLE